MVAASKQRVLAGETFQTQKELRQRVREILYRYDIGQSVSSADHTLLAELFRHHDNAGEKIGAGVWPIEVVADGYGSRHFQITRFDGSQTDISYQRCLRAATPRMRFSAAARTAVAEQVIAYKRERVPSGIQSATVHVDHEYPDTFEHLVERYIAARRLDLGLVSYADAGDRGQRFADRAMELDWQSFHRLHARLRIISALENLRLGNAPTARGAAPTSAVHCDSGTGA